MKRFSIFLVLLMTASFVFSQRLPKKLAKQFEDTGLFYFKYHHKGLNAKPDILNEALLSGFALDDPEEERAEGGDEENSQP